MEITSLSFLSTILICIHIGGLISALDALALARSSQSAIAWCVSLVLLPEASLPIYWIFGRDRFKGYAELLKEFRLNREREVSAYENIYKRYVAHAVSLERTAEAQFESIAGDEFTTFNSGTLLIDGERCFDAMLKAIDSATAYVLLQSYIIRADSVGQRFKQSLMRAAQRGARVYVLYDEVGSSALADNWKADLAACGARVEAFATRRGRGNFFQVNFRNHRKLLIVDGKSAFVGGLNIGDEYLGKDHNLNPWRDTQLEVRGPAVMQLQRIFLADWLWAAGEELALDYEPASTGHCQMLPVATGPADELQNCLFLYLEMIRSARSKLWLASPYFVPPEPLMAALQMAALRKVDVRILLPSKPDHYLVWLASFPYLRELLRCGIKVYRYPGFNHQKVSLIDDGLCSIGTVNLDNRSILLNFEVTLLAADAALAGQIEHMLLHDFSISKQLSLAEVDNQPLHLRMGQRLARLFAPIL